MTIALMMMMMMRETGRRLQKTLNMLSSSLTLYTNACLISCHVSSRHGSCDTSNTSLVTSLTSHVTPLTSHVTSHVTSLTSHVMSRDVIIIHVTPRDITYHVIHRLSRDTSHPLRKSYYLESCDTTPHVTDHMTHRITRDTHHVTRHIHHVTRHNVRTMYGETL